MNEKYFFRESGIHHYTFIIHIIQRGKDGKEKYLKTIKTSKWLYDKFTKTEKMLPYKKARKHRDSSMTVICTNMSKVALV